MKEIKYTVTDELGVHARPAGQLVKLAAKFGSDIKICFNGKAVDAKRIFGVMSLAIKQGDEMIITIEGEDEELAFEEIDTFVKENL